MEGNGWRDVDTECWNTCMESPWTDVANNWSSIGGIAAAGSPAAMGIGGGGGVGSIGPWNVSGGGSGGGGGGSDWQGMQPNWTDPVSGYGPDKGDEWDIPEDWGIEAPGAFQNNMLMEDPGFTGVGGMFGDFSNFNNCNSGGFMGGGADVGGGVGVVGGGGGSLGIGVGGGAGGMIGGGSGGGLESDPIDFDIDGLISASGPDALGGVGGGLYGGMGGAGGGLGGGGGVGGSWCSGMPCCQQQGGGHFSFI